MSIIYLIRHAQASFGKTDYDCLSDRGHRQSDILAAHFQELGLEFDAIYSGAQLRHAQTLTAYLNKLSESGNPAPSVRKTDAFNEYDSENILKTLIPEMIRSDPSFEADVVTMISDRRSFQKVYEKIMRKWVNSQTPLKNLESWQSYSERVLSGLQKVMTGEGAGKTVAIYTSGGPISVCVQKALNLSDEKTLQLTWQIMNASVTRLKFSGSRMMLFSFNDVTHLERLHDKQLLTYR